ncbi:uncharacterized protein LOC143040284 isoform X2 [Oratosquilla oratoria]|uniref:uncharacterized protein LOC143040284 isoform X2 n=1 Tax=Oratosquilla oratoria TaxID=337810 RepID=UPI003F75F07A
MSSAAGGTLQDRTLNKVALCSAVFAGFAYVGYSYAKTAFCRKLARKPGLYDDDEEMQTRMVFRRLSQTTQTDVLLGNLDMSGSGRLIVRPKTVQERIRELNLKARQFTDAFIAIQTGNGHAGHALTRNSAIHAPNSLQCSPWGSPRMLSPVDVRHLITSRSTENLTQIPPDGSPGRPKWVRKSLRRKKKGTSGSDAGEAEDKKKQQEAEALKMCKDSRDELEHRMETLSVRGRVLTPYEAKSLVALLYSEDKSLIERSLVTIANCAAFSVNLDFFREVGCLYRLTTLLSDPDIRLAAVQTLGNVVLSEENIKQAKDCIGILIGYIQKNQCDEALCLASLVVLTNIATITEWHEDFCPILHKLYHLVDIGSPHVKLQSLRLLVNISCNKEMIPSLLAAEGPRKLASLVDMETNEDLLLRVLVLLGTLAQAVADDKLDPTTDLPPDYKAASPDTIHDADSSTATKGERYARLFGINVRERLLAKVQILMRKHENTEVQRLATRLHQALKD